MLKNLLKIAGVLIAISMMYYFYLGYIEDEALLEEEYDIEMGRRVVENILSEPEEYPILPEEGNEEAYQYLSDLMSQVIEGPEIKYNGVFKYDSIRIIHDDSVLNAFCTPGGFIFVYTGLIKYLDAKDHLVGVLGHEIAHAELRHSIIGMQQQYGRKKLLQFLILTPQVSLGAAVRLKMMTDLLNLDYSRDDEADADKHSVHYLESTSYACNGTAGFFEKLLNEEDHVEIPAFLSDHPDSRSRVRDINKEAQKIGCNTQLGDQSDWKHFQSLIPASDTVAIDSTKKEMSDQ